MDFSTVPARKGGKGEKKLLAVAGPAPFTATPVSLTDSSIPQELTTVLPVWETA